MINSGNFDESLSLTASRAIDLVTARIGGDLNSGTWTFSGAVLNISARSTASAWSLNGAGLVQSLRLSGSLNSNIQTGALGLLTVKGNLGDSNSHISIQALTSFDAHALRIGVIHVAGTVTNAIIFSNGNIGSITVGKLVGSGIYAGVSSTIAGSLGMPASDSDYLAPTAFINSIHLGRGTPAFSQSVIAAGVLKAVNVSVVNTTGATAQNGNPIPFGVAAEIFGSLTAILDTGKTLSLTRAQLKSAAVLTAFETKKGITTADLHDFTITVVPQPAKPKPVKK